MACDPPVARPPCGEDRKQVSVAIRHAEIASTESCLIKIKWYVLLVGVDLPDMLSNHQFVREYHASFLPLDTRRPKTTPSSGASDCHSKPTLAILNGAADA